MNNNGNDEEEYPELTERDVDVLLCDVSELLILQKDIEHFLEEAEEEIVAVENNNLLNNVFHIGPSISVQFNNLIEDVNRKLRIDHIVKIYLVWARQVMEMIENNQGQHWNKSLFEHTKESYNIILTVRPILVRGGLL